MWPHVLGMYRLNCCLQSLGVWSYECPSFKLDNLLKAFPQLSRKNPLVALGAAPFWLVCRKSVRVFYSLEHWRKGSDLLSTLSPSLWSFEGKPLRHRGLCSPWKPWDPGPRLWVLHSHWSSGRAPVTIPPGPTDTELPLGGELPKSVSGCRTNPFLPLHSLGPLLAQAPTGKGQKMAFHPQPPERSPDGTKQLLLWSFSSLKLLSKEYKALPSWRGNQLLFPSRLISQHTIELFLVTRHLEQLQAEDCGQLLWVCSPECVNNDKPGLASFCLYKSRTLS